MRKFRIGYRTRVRLVVFGVMAVLFFLLLWGIVSFGSNSVTPIPVTGGGSQEEGSSFLLVVARAIAFFRAFILSLTRGG